MLGIETAPLEALGRLCAIARRDTGQSRRVASFLLAWHNAEENGGWDPTDLWNVDTAVAEDLMIVLRLCQKDHPLATFGTISWPELEVWEASGGRNCRGDRVSRDTGRCFVFMESQLEGGLGSLLLDGCRQKQVQCAAGNHPTAVQKWNHNLAKMAIGWSQ